MFTAAVVSVSVGIKVTKEKVIFFLVKIILGMIESAKNMQKKADGK